MSDVSRRRFLAESALIVPTLLACSGSVTGDDAPAGNGISISGDSIRLELARIPALKSAGGALVVAEANVIALHAQPGQYRAFSNICTHAGCGIYQFVELRMRCQCHGSEFDIDGINVAGPAPTPLERYDTTLEANGNVLRIARRK